MREKLIALIHDAIGGCGTYWVSLIVDHLIANGVTIPVRCKECRYYNPDGEYCGFWGWVQTS